MVKLIFSFLCLFLTTFSAFGLSGKEVYEQTCAACHGPDGKGQVPGAANFTSAQGPLSKSDEVLLEHITKGYQTPGSSSIAMPPKGGNPKLTEDDLKNALAYIREKFAPKK